MVIIYKKSNIGYSNFTEQNATRRTISKLGEIKVRLGLRTNLMTSSIISYLLTYTDSINRS